MVEQSQRPKLHIVSDCKSLPVRRIRSFAAGFGARVQLHESAQTLQEPNAIILTDNLDLILDLPWRKRFTPSKILLCGVDMPPEQLTAQLPALSFYSPASVARLFEAHLPRATILRQLTRCEVAEFHLAWGAMHRRFAKPSDLLHTVKSTLRAERWLSEVITKFIDSLPPSSCCSIASDGVTLMVSAEVDPSSVDVTLLMNVPTTMGQVLVQKGKFWRVTLALPLVLTAHGEHLETMAPIFIGTKEDGDLQAVRLDQTG